MPFMPSSRLAGAASGAPRSLAPGGKAARLRPLERTGNPQILTSASEMGLSPVLRAGRQIFASPGGRPFCASASGGDTSWGAKPESSRAVRVLSCRAL